jgi:hypothetical protein
LVVSKVCDALTHPLVVVKSHAGFSYFFSDFSDEGLTDVALFDMAVMLEKLPQML